MLSLLLSRPRLPAGDRLDVESEWLELRTAHSLDDAHLATISLRIVIHAVAGQVAGTRTLPGGLEAEEAGGDRWAHATDDGLLTEPYEGAVINRTVSVVAGRAGGPLTNGVHSVLGKGRGLEHGLTFVAAVAQCVSR